MGYIWKTPYSHSFHIKRTKRDRGYLGQVRSGEIRPNEGTKIRVQLQREEKLKHKNKLSGKSYPYDETGYFKKKKKKKKGRKGKEKGGPLKRYVCGVNEKGNENGREKK
ncbi:hypothetical protein I7I50_08655 [Histoplasma capsulatum G186AR]|nr:hypothetical protein I7I50_08655 [Histoplasma capsulatum G186AR]